MHPIDHACITYLLLCRFVVKWPPFTIMALFSRVYFKPIIQVHHWGKNKTKQNENENNKKKTLGFSRCRFSYSSEFSREVACIKFYLRIRKPTIMYNAPSRSHVLPSTRHVYFGVSSYSVKLWWKEVVIAYVLLGQCRTWRILPHCYCGIFTGLYTEACTTSPSRLRRRSPRGMTPLLET